MSCTNFDVWAISWLTKLPFPNIMCSEVVERGWVYFPNMISQTWLRKAELLQCIYNITILWLAMKNYCNQHAIVFFYTYCQIVKPTIKAMLTKRGYSEQSMKSTGMLDIKYIMDMFGDIHRLKVIKWVHDRNDDEVIETWWTINLNNVNPGLVNPKRLFNWEGTI
jgi:hypothetical protein